MLGLFFFWEEAKCQTAPLSLGVKSEDPRVKLFLFLLDKDMVKLLFKDWVVKNFKGTAIWWLYHDVNSPFDRSFAYEAISSTICLFLFGCVDIPYQSGEINPVIKC